MVEQQKATIAAEREESKRTEDQNARMRGWFRERTGLDSDTLSELMTHMDAENAQLQTVVGAAYRVWTDRSDHHMMLLGQALTDEDYRDPLEAENARLRKVVDVVRQERDRGRINPPVDALNEIEPDAPERKVEK